MPKTKISEYSTTNADNTDIESINIAEGCAPSGINNAIRELMVHLKEFQTGASGDGFTFAGGTLMTGTNTLSGTNVLSGSTTAAFAAGTVSAPSIAAHGDTNTGIFFPAADTIAFAEGGAEAMRIDSSGNLLVGGTSQSGTANRVAVFSANKFGLSIIDTTAQTTGVGGALNLGGNYRTAGDAQAFARVAALKENATDANYAYAMGFYTTPNGGTFEERMRIDSSGNVGIGTSSPTVKLGVSGQISSSGGIAFSGALASGTGVASSGANGDLRFYANGIQYVTLNTSGNVGIGTSSPGTKLEVSHSSLSYTDGLILTNSLNFGYGNSITFRAVLTDGGSVGNAARIQQSYEASNNYNLIFSTTASGTLTERARITSGGYFKASNSGSYVGSTGGYHEFSQSGSSECLIPNATNASYTNDIVQINANRSATSEYDFLTAFSGTFTDREFQLRGDGNGYADGTWNNNGADYAEYFESANGQALTLGATVVLDGTKVREATAQDDPKNIIGVVRPKEPSKASMVVGNTAWNKWANKYLTDDFDRYIMEDHDVVEWEEQVLEKEAVAAVEAVLDEEGNEVSAAIPAQEAVYKTVQHSYESHNIPAGITVPDDAVRKTHDDKGSKFQHYKLNPAWNKDAEYTPREKRPEWNIIGLLGQVKILKGQPVSDRWIKMRDVSATVEEWMIR